MRIVDAEWRPAERPTAWGNLIEVAAGEAREDVPGYPPRYWNATWQVLVDCGAGRVWRRWTSRGRALAVHHEEWEELA